MCVGNWYFDNALPTKSFSNSNTNFNTIIIKFNCNFYFNWTVKEVNPKGEALVEENANFSSVLGCPESIVMSHWTLTERKREIDWLLKGKYIWKFSKKKWGDGKYNFFEKQNTFQ